MLKYFVWAGVIVLLVVAGVFVWKTLPNASKPAGQQSAPQQAATSTYATTTFSLVYPRDLTADESHVYDKVNPKKPIYGVKFAVATAMATGTNLSSDTYLSVEQLPRAKKCTGDIYLAANVKPSALTENGVGYSVATSSGAAAGNLYEEMVYALSGSSPCTAVRYYIHSSNIGNYATSTVREFDRVALLAGFDKIRQSLVLNPTVSTTTP
ncbi:MAG: hypothetical protein Q7S50_01280 [bacterium]|nr:hypothetical protein [bacterium]